MFIDVSTVSHFLEHWDMTVMIIYTFAGMAAQDGLKIEQVTSVLL